MAEQLSQSDIDILTSQYLSETGVDASIVLKETENIDSKSKSKTMLSMLKRLEYARENESFYKVREARKSLHIAAFDLWLSRKGMTRNEYYALMNKELKKRGLPEYFKV